MDNVDMYATLLCKEQDEGYSISGHGKPWSLHGLSTCVNPQGITMGLVVAAFLNLQGLSC